MTVSELTMNQLFTSAPYLEWGVLKYMGQTGDTCYALVTEEEPRSWMPDPDRPIWLTPDTEVEPL